MNEAPAYLCFPFPLESQRIMYGVRDGIPWVAAQHPSSVEWNGYAYLPEGHPWRDLKDWELAGWTTEEITYAEHGWIGFDTLHAFDYWPSDEGEMLVVHSRGRILTPHRVAALASNLAAEVAAHADNHDDLPTAEGHDE